MFNFISLDVYIYIYLVTHLIFICPTVISGGSIRALRSRAHIDGLCPLERTVMANERMTTTRDNGKYEGLTLCSYHPTIGRWRG